MRQYEIAIRIAQVHHLADERKYRKALTVIQTLDMRQVRNVSDLKVFAEVYTRTEQLAEAKATYLRIYKKSRTRKILYRLIYLAIRTNNLEEAEKYYDEFVRMNPNNRDALILRYRIDKAAGVQISQLIDILRDLKEEEYVEEWAYELAKLYQQAGRYEECREECEDIKLWFGTGEIVERAKLLLDHIQENDPMPFLDDTDFTDPINREKPNPDDTGSLPDLSEYLQSSSEQEMKLLKKADPAKFEEIVSEKVTTEDVPAAVETDKKAEKPEALQKLSGLFFGNKANKAEEDTLAAEGDQPDEPQGDETETVQDSAAEELAAGIQDAEEVPEDAVSAGEDMADTEQNAQMTVSAEEDSQAAEESGHSEEDAEETDQQGKIEIDPADFPRISQSGTGITQDLAKEISAIYEAEHQAQLKEKTVTVIQELPNVANDVVERMTEAEVQSETKEYIPMDTERSEEPEDLSGTTVVVPDLATDSETVKQTEVPSEQQPEDRQGTEKSAIETIARQLRDAEAFEKLPEDAGEVSEDASAETDAAAASELNTELQLLKALEKELQEAEAKIEKTVAVAADEIEAAAGQETAVAATAQEVIEAVEDQLQNQAEAPVAAETEPEPDAEISPQAEEEAAAAVEEQKQDVQTQEPASATGEVLPEKDLPTTRALHRSFADILILIGGEMDPSHFVLIGDGKARILGIAKKIAVVMRETGYLSSGRIAHIAAEQLNVMELSQFKKQLKGNCLLITNAAELLFPTITKVFSIMDEFYGDFTVILSDEGATLDQLFRFVPALARRFKYVIDISQYTEQDYK